MTTHRDEGKIVCYSKFLAYEIIRRKFVCCHELAPQVERSLENRTKLRFRI